MSETEGKPEDKTARDQKIEEADRAFRLAEDRARLYSSLGHPAQFFSWRQISGGCWIR